MDNFDVPFEEWMLEEPRGVAIHCPTPELFADMAKILDAHGIEYGSGRAHDHLHHWNNYKEDTCYYSRPGANLLYGPKSSAYESPWSRYLKCTFYGNEREFEPAPDIVIDELFV